MKTKRPKLIQPQLWVMKYASTDKSNQKNKQKDK